MFQKILMCIHVKNTRKAYQTKLIESCKMKTSEFKH